MDGEEASWTVHGNGVTTLPTTHCQQGRWGALRLPHLIVKRSYTEFYMMSANLKIFRFLKDTNKTPGKVAFNLYAVNLKSLIWFNSLSFFFFFNFLNLFIYFMAVLGLRFCARAFSSCGERGLLFVAVHGLLTTVASLVGEHGF